MRAGSMRCLFRFQAVTETTNAQSEPVSDWADVASPEWWASDTAMEGREAERAGISLAQVPHLLLGRYRSDVTPEMRLMRGGVPYWIVSAVDPDQRGRELRVIATERK